MVVERCCVLLLRLAFWFPSKLYLCPRCYAGISSCSASRIAFVLSSLEFKTGYQQRQSKGVHAMALRSQPYSKVSIRKVHPALTRSRTLL